MNDKTLCQDPIIGNKRNCKININNSISYFFQREIKFEAEFRYTNADSTLIMGALQNSTLVMGTSYNSIIFKYAPNIESKQSIHE